MVMGAATMVEAAVAKAVMSAAAAAMAVKAMVVEVVAMVMGAEVMGGAAMVMKGEAMVGAAVEKSKGMAVAARATGAEEDVQEEKEEHLAVEST